MWQGRFFSSPLDETYLWAAIRYVERNPVRAHMVERAENYRWSSARGHCGLKNDGVLGKQKDWKNMLVSTADWSDWLSIEEDDTRLAVLRKHVEKGLPCGSEGFVEMLGNKIGRVLEFRHQGRPRKGDKKG